MNKIKQYNWYKIGFLSVCGALFILTLYFAAYGAVERAEAFATWMNGGMSPEAVAYMQCLKKRQEDDAPQYCDHVINNYEL